MSVHFDPQKRIYDLYSFDAPYDLEPTGSSEFLQDYGERPDSHQHLARADAEDQDDEFRCLDLTIEEAETGRHFSDPGLRLFPDRDRTSSQNSSVQPLP